MQQEITEAHTLDTHGNPFGGYTSATGMTLSWQAGPLAVDGERKEPNGVFVETVIAAALGRLMFYQSSKFACEANADAVNLLELALERLHDRTRDREARGVEGTHKL